MSAMIQRRISALGLKPMDSETPLRFEVTKADINGANPKNPAQCAIARAIQRQHGAVAAFVFRTTAWVQKGKRLIRYSIPPSLQAEIVAFDRGGKKAFAPGDYQLGAAPNPGRAARHAAAKKAGKHARAGEHAKLLKRRAAGVTKFAHFTSGVRTTDYQ